MYFSYKFMNKVLRYICLVVSRFWVHSCCGNAKAKTAKSLLHDFIPLNLTREFNVTACKKQPNNCTEEQAVLLASLQHVYSENRSLLQRKYLFSKLPLERT